MLQACQDEQNTLDYKSTLQTTIKPVWTRDIQKSGWHRLEEHWHEVTTLKKNQQELFVYLPPS